MYEPAGIGFAFFKAVCSKRNTQSENPMTATTLPARQSPIRPVGPLSAGQRSKHSSSCDAVLREVALVLHMTGLVKQAIVADATGSDGGFGSLSARPRR